MQRLTLDLGEAKEQNVTISVEKKDLENQLDNISKQIETTKRMATEQYMPHITQMQHDTKELEVCLNSDGSLYFISSALIL